MILGKNIKSIFGFNYEKQGDLFLPYLGIEKSETFLQKNL